MSKAPFLARRPYGRLHARWDSIVFRGCVQVMDDRTIRFFAQILTVSSRLTFSKGQVITRDLSHRFREPNSPASPSLWTADNTTWHGCSSAISLKRATTYVNFTHGDHDSGTKVTPKSLSLCVPAFLILNPLPSETVIPKDCQTCGKTGRFITERGDMRLIGSRPFAVFPRDRVMKKP